ncbi:SGNH/GDSL hydrolase family protein [bacterium]|nr:SGNH/GDSL hydrolase family protein [bacterium]
MNKIVVLLGSPIIFFMISEFIIWSTGINESYRRNYPSALIEEDSIYVHRVRPDLDCEVPRYANLELTSASARSLEQVGQYRVITNTHGFREDREIPLEAGVDEYRLICLGDSVTFGWGSDNTESYPQLLGQELRSWNGLKYDVINAGQPGFNSYQCLLFYQNELRLYRPDLLIVACGHNDHHLGIRGYPSARAKVQRMTTGLGAVKMCLRHFESYLLLERIIEKLVGKMAVLFGKDVRSEMARPGSVEEYMFHLIQLAKEVEDHDGHCLFLTEPRVNREPVTDSYNRALLELASQQSIRVIDLVPLFDREMERLITAGDQAKPPNSLFWDDVHPTPLGNRIIARTIASYLKAPETFLADSTGN